MWIADETWTCCPDCGWGYGVILTVSDDWRAIEMRCRDGHRYTHETSAPERLHLMPPEPPPKPRQYSVHRGRSEDGPWTRGAVVRDFDHGQEVVDRWRRERPDLWMMVAIDGSPFMKARPWREVRVFGAELG